MTGVEIGLLWVGGLCLVLGFAVGWHGAQYARFRQLERTLDCNIGERRERMRDDHYHTGYADGYIVARCEAFDSTIALHRYHHDALTNMVRAARVNP